MTLAIPETAIDHGIVLEGLGTHSSRTMMLSELELLLASCPPNADTETYRTAIIDENVLLKRTVATRAKSFRHLRELYGLDPEIVLFRALRSLWDQTSDAHPLLALLCALARDPSLRSTASAVMGASPGASITSAMLAGAAENEFPTLSKETTLAKIGRNAASSWTQSGHVRGRSAKTRSKAKALPASTAYALFLGYLCGERGEGLFNTLWARILDAPQHVLHEQAFAASQQGWLEYRHSGMVTEITFRHLLRAEG